MTEEIKKPKKSKRSSRHPVTLNMSQELWEDTTKLANDRNMSRSKMLCAMIKERMYADLPLEAYHYVILMDTLKDKKMTDKEKNEKCVDIVNELIKLRRLEQK